MSDLQKQIDSLKQKIEDRAYEADKKEAGQWQVKTAADIGAFARFLAQLAVAGMWIHEHILLPVARFFAILGGFFFGWYRRLWARLVYVEDRFKQKQFSKTRAGLLLTATILFLWFALIPLLTFAFDVGLYFATVRRDEVVYLTNSQEIMPESNVHSVQGCYDLPCTDDNSIYFRIRGTLFNELWSLVHGYGLFFPDYIAAAVPVTISECKITVYGIRMKLMMRGFDIYPDVLRTECSPLTGKAAEEAAPAAGQNP